MTTDVLIQVQDLKKHFAGASPIKALDGVSADIRKGEVVVVIGPSGSGKSTFLRCLNLLEVPTGGRILFNGVDITDKSCNINLHRQKMGMVFQHFNLFPHMTILRNMTLAPVKLLHKSQEEADAQALKLLQRVGLGDRGGAGTWICRSRRAALRRTEAARGHRPRAHDGAGGHALRRADERARPGDGR